MCQNASSCPSEVCQSAPSCPLERCLLEYLILSFRNVRDCFIHSHGEVCVRMPHLNPSENMSECLILSYRCIRIPCFCHMPSVFLLLRHTVTQANLKEETDYRQSIIMLSSRPICISKSTFVILFPCR